MPKDASAKTLTFRYDEDSRHYPHRVMLEAFLPDGTRVGHLEHIGGKRIDSPIRVKQLYVEPDHRRKGYASALMDELYRHYSRSRIIHGDRTNEGKAWWRNYSPPERGMFGGYSWG